MQIMDVDRGQWLLLTVDEAEKHSAIPLACLVGECTESLPPSTMRILERIAKAGCKLLSFVGSRAEDAHDSMDYVLEEAGLFDVVTSWHSGPAAWQDAVTTISAMEYGKKLNVMCVLIDSSESLERVVSAIKAGP
jgi:hypothetical protein